MEVCDGAGARRRGISRIRECRALKALLDDAPKVQSSMRPTIAENEARRTSS